MLVCLFLRYLSNWWLYLKNIIKKNIGPHLYICDLILVALITMLFHKLNKIQTIYVKGRVKSLHFVFSIKIYEVNTSLYGRSYTPH